MAQVIIGKAIWDALQAEKERVVPKSRFRTGCFESEALCLWQAQKANEGYQSIELVESIYGWSVRYASGLQDFALLAGRRKGNLDGSLEDAFAWSLAWTAQDLAKRFVFAPDKVVDALAQTRSASPQ